MSSKHIDTVIDHVNKEMRFLAREVEFVVPECLQDSSACEIMFIWRHAWLLVVNRTVLNIGLISCSNASLWASGSLYLLAAHGVFGLYGIRWLISRNGGSSLGSSSTKISSNSVNNKSR